MSKMPWWFWLVICAAVAGGGASLDWFARFGWAVGSGAAREGIEFVEGGSGAAPPQLPVSE